MNELPELERQRIAAEEKLKGLYRGRDVVDKDGYLRKLREETYAVAAWFISERGDYEAAADFAELNEAAETTLVEKLSGSEAQKVALARRFFANRPWAENIDSFRKMSNYQQLLDIGAKLISDKGEAEIERLYEKGEKLEKVEVGFYIVRVEYLHRSGETKQLNQGFHVFSATDTVGLEKAARGAITGMGLHNFGLDVDSSKYPLGQKVNFEIVDEEKNQASESSYFTVDGNGYSVKRNREVINPAWLAEIDSISPEA